MDEPVFVKNYTQFNRSSSGHRGTTVMYTNNKFSIVTKFYNFYPKKTFEFYIVYNEEYA